MRRRLQLERRALPEPARAEKPAVSVVVLVVVEEVAQRPLAHRHAHAHTVVAGAAKALVVAIGLNKNPADKGQDAKIDVTRTPASGILTQWVVQKSNDILGTAVIVPASVFQGFAEDDRNLLALAKATPGQPLRYFAGAGWSRAGEFTTQASWNAYVAAAAARAQSPVKITLSSRQGNTATK